MLHTVVSNEARALVYLIQQGEDPEVASRSWVGATRGELEAVIKAALRIVPAEAGSKWVEDFRSGHKWLKDRDAKVCTCGAVLYNDCGAWFTADRDLVHTCWVSDPEAARLSHRDMLMGA
jgi:hypothetical protein